VPILAAIIRRKSRIRENGYYTCISQIIALSYGDMLRATTANAK
jgi:hypothetical protein